MDDDLANVIGWCWLVTVLAAVGFVTSGFEQWDLNGDGTVTIRDVWRLAKVVAVLPTVLILVGIALVTPRTVLAFFEFDSVAAAFDGILGVLFGAIVWIGFFGALFALVAKVHGWLAIRSKRRRAAAEARYIVRKVPSEKERHVGLDGIVYRRTGRR